MKKKEVEDVIGGKDAWENVDKADGEYLRVFYLVLSLWEGQEGFKGESGKESGARNGACISPTLHSQPTTHSQAPLPQPC